MEQQIFQVNAFTDQRFSGNPAAVVILESWLSDQQLQMIAAENYLPATAFIMKVKSAVGHDETNNYELRWFTPTTEILLCGHATLASAHALFHELKHKTNTIEFQTKSGLLTVKKLSSEKGLYELNLPSYNYEELKQLPQAIAQRLGYSPLGILRSKNKWVIILEEEQVRSFQQDFSNIQDEALGVILTSHSNHQSYDIVSRIFYLRGTGLTEDPVTGSAHCAILPYWSKILGKNKLTAYQASERGGTIYCEYKNNRAVLTGAALTFLRGTIEVSTSV